MRLTLAVTGASGFVGGAVCRAAVAAGHDVVCFGRRASVDPDHVGGAHYAAWDIAAGPLHTPPAPAVDAVVHCAGSVTDWGPEADLRAANVTGSINVLRSFPPPTRFVHVSTASVYDPRTPTVSALEDAVGPSRLPRHPDAYGRTKAEAERAVLEQRPDAVILRPHAVYGPGDTTLLPRVLGAIRGTRLPAVGSGHQLVSLTSVGNVARACLLAASTPGVSGVFNITDAEPVVLDAALRAILEARGLRAKPLYLPFVVAFPIAVLAEAAARIARRPPRVTRYAVRHLAVERTLDISGARARLGYDPAPTSFDGAASW
jgi:nucleoside-diphosphate-sugar epimerase